ncbi:enoyl-CoA hydratase/isomerase family protein [Microcoleus sp. N9_A1]|uniref:enoyl-CoA hydratase/isomerase family protein n=1 Tax=Microcoleus sp. N9_A1 TaxID=3055380 RepID=UPI002FD612DE
MSLVNEQDIENVRVITLNHKNRHNPFSEELENQIKEALNRAKEDNEVKAVIVTGGKDRSFSVGGDFNEVRLLHGGDDVDRWIDRVIDLYASVLQVDKPTIAAIDGYAIGMGLQFALMFDWRIISSTAELQMPELRHGIGCSVGSAILGHAIGHNAMQEIVFACESITPEMAKSYHLVNQIVPTEVLLEQALLRAKEFASYPEIPYRLTKNTISANMLDIIYKSADKSKHVHRMSFSSKSAEAHFSRVLNRSVE